VVHQNYDYYNDGRISFVHNTTDANFDRSYFYDQSGRLTEAKSGSLVNGFQNAPIPFHETFAYDAFSNLTSRFSTNWGQDELSDIADYSGNRRSGWGYDADGRNTTISTRIYTYDAAGQMTLMTGQKFVLNHYFNTSQSEGYDGDGTKVSENIIGQPTYYLCSTVMNGALIEEINNSGQKSVGYVYAEGQLLAQQSSNQVTWKQITAAGTSQYDLPQSGGPNRVEFDAVGADIGVNAPMPPDTGGQTGDIGGSHFGGIMDARWSNFFDQSAGCTSFSGELGSCSERMADENDKNPGFIPAGISGIGRTGAQSLTERFINYGLERTAANHDLWRDRETTSAFGHFDHFTLGPQNPAPIGRPSQKLPGCIFDIVLKDTSKLGSKGLAALKEEITRIFAAAGQEINFVANGTASDYQLTIFDVANGHAQWPTSVGETVVAGGGGHAEG
jgi:hypothetical protein